MSDLEKLGDVSAIQSMSISINADDSSDSVSIFANGRMQARIYIKILALDGDGNQVHLDWTDLTDRLHVVHQDYPSTHIEYISEPSQGWGYSFRDFGYEKTMPGNSALSEESSSKIPNGSASDAFTYFVSTTATEELKIGATITLPNGVHADTYSGGAGSPTSYVTIKGHAPLIYKAADFSIGKPAYSESGTADKAYVDPPNWMLMAPHCPKYYHDAYSVGLKNPPHPSIKIKDVIPHNYTGEQGASYRMNGYHRTSNGIYCFFLWGNDDDIPSPKMVGYNDYEVDIPLYGTMPFIMGKVSLHAFGECKIPKMENAVNISVFNIRDKYYIYSVYYSDYIQWNVESWWFTDSYFEMVDNYGNSSKIGFNSDSDQDNRMFKFFDR